jgi:hypothetical protein
MTRLATGPSRNIRFIPHENRNTADAWMDANPELMDVCLEIARDLLDQNPAYVSMDALRFLVRQREVLATPGLYKFCTTHSPYVARWLLLTEPQLLGALRCHHSLDEQGLQMHHIITRADGGSPWVILEQPHAGG